MSLTPAVNVAEETLGARYDDMPDRQGAIELLRSLRNVSPEDAEEQRAAYEALEKALSRTPAVAGESDEVKARAREIVNGWISEWGVSCSFTEDLISRVASGFSPQPFQITLKEAIRLCRAAETCGVARGRADAIAQAEEVARAEHRKGLANLKDNSDSDYDLGYTEASHLIAVNILALSASYGDELRAEIKKYKALADKRKAVIIETRQAFIDAKFAPMAEEANPYPNGSIDAMEKTAPIIEAALQAAATRMRKQIVKRVKARITLTESALPQPSEKVDAAIRMKLGELRELAAEIATMELAPEELKP